MSSHRYTDCRKVSLLSNGRTLPKLEHALLREYPPP